MTLDAAGPELIELRIAGSGDRLVPAFMLIDTLDAIKAPTHARATSRLVGTLVGVFACCTRRSAARHAEFHFREPVASVAAPVSTLTTQIRQETDLLNRFCERLARAVGGSATRVAEDLRSRRVLDAEEAQIYGLLKPDGGGEIATRAAGGPRLE
jgi:ATP-dependent Clp protease protease subunit